MTDKRRVCKTEKGVDSSLQVRDKSQLMIIGGADYQVVPLKSDWRQCLHIDFDLGETWMRPQAPQAL
jgi:hypothetical protein